MSFTNSVMFILGLSLVVLGINGDNVASFIDPCQIKDNACVLASAIKAMPHIVKGNKELGIPTADPMHFDHINGNTGELELEFNDLTVIGASECILLKVERNEKYSAELEAECPISANGDYIVGGKLLQYPVYGKDKFEFTTDKIRFKVSITLKTIIGKDGQEYYKIAKFDYSFDPIGEVTIIFKNLYNGDEEKAAPINALIKQSGKDFLVTLGKEVIAEIIKKFVNVVNHLFIVIPSSQVDKP